MASHPQKLHVDKTCVNTTLLVTKASKSGMKRTGAIFAVLHKFSAECVLPDDYGAGTLISINNVIQTGLSALHSNNNVINWHFISYVLLALLHLAGKLLPIGTKTRF